MLTALTTQILVMMYIMIFAAAIRLRYTQPDAPSGPTRSPAATTPACGSSRGMGILGSVFALVIGFFPPSGISHWPTPDLHAVRCSPAIVICSVPPFLVD